MANEIDSKIEQFKSGIFSLRTNFGELAQLMIQEKYHLACADDNTYECFILGKHTARNGVAGISPPRREFQKC